jgi:hypothetical protein
MTVPDSLRDQLQRSARLDAHPPVEAIIARGDKLARRRRLLATVLVVGVVGAAGVTGSVALTGGGSGTAKVVRTPSSALMPASTAPAPSTVPPTSVAPTSVAPASTVPATSVAPTSTPADRAAALLPAEIAAFTGAHGPEYAAAGPVESNGGIYAAISYNVATPNQGTNPHVAILSFDGTRWAPATDLTLDIGGMVLAPSTRATPIAVEHYTAASTPDFAVMVNYNAGPAVALISGAGGTWHRVTFSAPGRAAVDEVLNPTLGPSTVSSVVNTCVPDCAAGRMQRFTYHYSVTSGTMIGS